MTALSPTVSVLVPIYNVENYLEQCLDSLIDQTFSDFEVICINDGSKDGSRAIIQKYLDKDRRFKVIDKENSGYGISMNMGLDAASGKYVAILESDDFYEPDCLEKLVGAAEANDAQVVKASFWLYWSNTEKKELFKIIDDQEAGRTMAPLDDKAIFFRKPSIWSALYNREFLNQNQIRFLETPGASYQDAGFCFKVWAAAERASFIADPVLFYRQDNESSSVNSAAKVYCVCDEYKSMEQYIHEHCVEHEADLKAILERMKFDSYLWNYERLSDELRREFVEFASKEFARDLEIQPLDSEYFDPLAAANLKLWANDVPRFVEARELLVVPGFKSKLRHYLFVGGLPLAFKAAKYRRIEHHNLRRNDLKGACA